MGWLYLAAALPALLAILFFALALGAFRRRRRLGGSVHLLVATLCLSLVALFAVVALGMQGYQALTRETTAATVTVARTGPQRFEATFVFPDGDRRAFALAGDELYVDARILKWHPQANLLGLHTAFELDRVAGRYTSIDDEQTEPRTVYRLRPERSLDLFEMARRYPFVDPLLDAEYGSGTFLPVGDGDTYVVRVSTSGLLIRRAGGDR